MLWSVHNAPHAGGFFRGTRRPRRGAFALLLVMIVIFSSFVLGMGYLCSTSVRLASSGNFVASAKARSSAEAGLEHAKHILYTNPSLALSITQASPMGPYVLDGNTLYRFYFAPGSGTNSLYTPVGVGSCGGISLSCSMTVRVRNKFYSTLQGFSPESHWRLGEGSGTLARDEENRHSGWYQNGVTLGQASPLVGETNTGARFDGTNDCVDLDAFDLPVSAVTIAAWVKPDAGSIDGRYIICKPDSGVSDSQCWSMGTVVVSGQNKCFFRLRTSIGVTWSLLSGGTVSSGQWTLLVAVYTGSNMILYQDGVEVSRMAKTGTVKSNSSADVWIGANPVGSASNYWKGWLDEVAVFKSALSAAQVKSLWAARNPELTIMSWNE